MAKSMECALAIYKIVQTKKKKLRSHQRSSNVRTHFIQISCFSNFKRLQSLLNKMKSKHIKSTVSVRKYPVYEQTC